MTTTRRRQYRVAMNSAGVAAVPYVSRTTQRHVLVASLAALTAIGVLLVSRRVAGAYSTPLDVVTLTVTLLVAVAIVIAGRVAWGQLVVDQSQRSKQAIAWTGTVAVWLLWLGCAPPSLQSFSWLVGLPILAAEHFSRRRSRIPPLTPPCKGGELRRPRSRATAARSSCRWRAGVHK